MNQPTNFLRRQGCHILSVLVDYHVIEYGGRRWDRIIQTEKDANDWMNEIESQLCRENARTNERRFA